MKRYYFMLARLSLGVIILQACLFLYFGLNSDKINQRIDLALQNLASQPSANFVEREVRARVYQEVSSAQAWNIQHHATMKITLGLGLLQVACVYSLYIHFLRMGYTWTKVALHFNNLSMAFFLPPVTAIVWLFGYIVGTRLYKHFCVVSHFEPSTGE